MKLIGLFFFSGILFFVSFSQATCVDFTGDYDSGLLNGSKGSLVWSLKQNGCDSIALGSYYRSGNVKTDEIAPKLLYVHQSQQQQLCPKSCLLFTETTDGIEYSRNDTVVVNFNRCSYNKVEMLINDQGLVHKFYIADNTPNCRNIKVHTIVFERVQ